MTITALKRVAVIKGTSMRISTSTSLYLGNVRCHNIILIYHSSPINKRLNIVNITKEISTNLI